MPPPRRRILVAVAYVTIAAPLAPCRGLTHADAEQKWPGLEPRSFFEQRQQPVDLATPGEVGDVSAVKISCAVANRLGLSPQGTLRRSAKFSSRRISVLEGVRMDQPLFTQTVDTPFGRAAFHPDPDAPNGSAIRASRASLARHRNWVGVMRASVRLKNLPMLTLVSQGAAEPESVALAHIRVQGQVCCGSTRFYSTCSGVNAY